MINGISRVMRTAAIISYVYARIESGERRADAIRCVADRFGCSERTVERALSERTIVADFLPVLGAPKVGIETRDMPF